MPDIDFGEQMDRAYERKLEAFTDSIILVQGDDANGIPAVTVEEHPQIYEAISYLMVAINQRATKGKGKAVAQEMKDEWIQQEKFIGGEKKNKFSRWAINDRIVIKEALMNLYIQLNEYPHGTSTHPDDKAIIMDKVNSGNYKPTEIPKTTQAQIVYEVYDFTDYENEWGQKYSDKKYYPNERAVKSLLRDRRRQFEKKE